MSRNILIVIGILIIILLGVFFFLISRQNRNNSLGNSLGWKLDENGWKAIGNPPPCEEPLRLEPITDISKATSVLYPGQMRSVGYENTAGFRFDKQSNNDITVRAPTDGMVVQAARFLVDGQLQYVIDIMSPCGIMNRFDHILTLSPKLEEMANNLPEPKANDSRSTYINPPIKVSAGEILATSVGLTNNTFLSWTVFDFRKKNKISEDPNWANTHPVMDHYAICPFLYLSLNDQEIIKSLPAADSISGSKSDFCD